MLFHDFSIHLSRIEKTSKRLEMTQLLAELFANFSPEETQHACYLLQGKLVPKHQSKEFQLSIKMVIRVLARLRTEKKQSTTNLFGESFDIDMVADIEQLNKQLGDLGLVAEKIITSAQNSELTLMSVYQSLLAIAEYSGKGSQEDKVKALLDLLQELDAVSAKYVVRIVLGKLRLGFSDMTMIDGLSWMLAGDKSLSTQIEKAYQKQADIGVIASQLKQQGITSLDQINVRVGTPVIPALCQRLNTAEEIIKKMKEVIAEPKYDGTRVQIHIRKFQSSKLQVTSFTRNLEDNSHMFPELLKLAEIVNCESCILDAEAIGYDVVSGRLLPFQQTIQRKRKHGISEMAETIPLKFFIFDILEKNGVSFIEQPLEKRKQVLRDLFSDTKQFEFAPYIETDSPVVLHDFHEHQLQLGLEGAVIKKKHSSYQSGRKAYSWVKIKETEGARGKLTDTVDCVVMGYFKATGERVGFEVGSMLVGILNKNQQVVTVSKVGSGITEEIAKECVRRFKEIKTMKKPELYIVDKKLTPDFWLEPQVVIEVAADEITISSVHSAQLALRFPRIIRFRDDKDWQQITTTDEIQSMQVV